MATYGLRIIKSSPYFGSNEQFGNTYHYTTQIGEPFPDEELALYIREAERLVTANDVNFIGWETWGPTDGSLFENVMRDQGVWNIPGAGTPQSGMYREVCALVTWPIPRSPLLNRRRWLRKFIRLPAFPGASVGAAVAAGIEPLAQSQRDLLKAYGDDVRSPTPLGLEDSLATSDGVEPNAATEVRPFLFTRQIGR